MMPTLHSKNTRFAPKTTSLFNQWNAMLLLLFMMMSGGMFGQVYVHDFGVTTINSHPYTATPPTLNANLSSSSWSNSTASWTSYLGSSGEAISLSNSSGTPTISLTFSVATGYKLNIDSFSFWNRRSGTGAQNWSMTINGVFTGNGSISSSSSGINTGNIIVATPIVNLTGTINVVISLSGASGTGTFRLDDFTLNGSVTAAGKTSTQTGDWNDPLTWTPTGAPSVTDNVTILNTHTVTMTTAETRNSGTTTTVNSGGTLAVAAAYNNNGTTTIEGSFQINAGGSATGNNDFVYGANGNLIFNHNGAVYGPINGTHKYWPSASGPKNVTLNTSSPINIEVSRTVTGTFKTASGVTLSDSAILTLNDICEINAGGFFANAPLFGSASTLVYNPGGTYGRGLEWSHNGVGTIGTTPGYPNNIQISNNTIFNYNNGTPGNKAIAGNLTIDSGSFYMDYGGNDSGGTLTIAGNVTNHGNFTLGNANGDDLYIGGNFSNMGNFNGNGRAIFFTKSGTQTVSSTSVLTIPYVVFAPASGSTTVQLLSEVIISAPSSGNAISFNNTNDVLDINGQTLTIGTAAVANTITGPGSFKGSTASSMHLLGTGSIGTIRFSGDNSLKSLVVNRESNVVGFSLGSSLTIAETLGLSNGIIDVTTNTLTLDTTSTIAASSSNYIIANSGRLQKNFNAVGSFTFPIGNSITEYTPATINFTAANFNLANVSMNVVNAKEPNNVSPTHFINRYWNMQGTGITNATYNFSGDFLATDVPSGASIANMKSGRNRVSTSAWIEDTSNLVANKVALTGMLTSDAVFNSAGGYNFTAGNPFKLAEINVKQALTSYPSASTYDFGTRPLGSATEITFTVENTGLETLNLGTATVTGSDFSLSQNYAATVNGNGTTTFKIKYQPSALGSTAGSISIPNNDISDLENPYIINFTGTGGYSATSDIVSAGSEATTISSIQNDAAITTVADGVEVWKFTIRDGGALNNDLDTAPTILNTLTMTQGVGNMIDDWSDAIQAVALFSGTTKVANGVVSTNQIVFTFSSPITVPDDTNVTLSMRLSIQANPNNTGGNIDGDDFQFSITNANTAAATGSQFSAFNVATSVNNLNVLSIVATQLVFVQQPTTTGINATMTPAVTVSATDVNGNRDLQYVGAVSITSTGTLTGTPVISNAVAGLATFSTLKHTVAGTGFNLKANSGAFNDVLSTAFDINALAIGSYYTTSNGTWPSGTATWKKVTAGGDIVATPNANTTDLLIIKHSITTNGAFSASGGVGTKLQIDNGGTFNAGHNCTFNFVQINSGGILSASVPSVDIKSTGGTLTVEAGGKVIINSATLNLADGLWDGVENFKDGSILEILKWDWNENTSTERLIGSADKVSKNADGYYFGNITIDVDLDDNFSLVGLTGEIKLCQNNLTISNSSTNKYVVLGVVSSDITIGGDLIINSGNFRFTTVNTSSPTYTITGDFIVNNGSANLNPTSTNSHYLTVKIHKNFKVGSGTSLLSSDADSKYVFAGNNIQDLDFAGTLGSNVDFEINALSSVRIIGQDMPLANSTNTFTVLANGMLNFNFNSTNIALNISGNGEFIAETGSTLKITSPQGITTSGTTGNVQTSTRTFATASPYGKYEYIGKENQVTGNALPQNVASIVANNTGTIGNNEVVLTNTLASAAKVDIQKGIFNLNEKTTVGDTIKIAADATLKIVGTHTFPSFTNRTFDINSIVEYGGTNQNIATLTSPAYAKLKVSGTGTKLLGADLVTVDNELEVASSLLKIENNKTLTVNNKITTVDADATLINSVPGDLSNISTTTTKGVLIQNNGSLVQIADANLNEGKIQMERIAQPMFRYDYTYWSSPVENTFTLNNLSPNTLANKYFKWNHSADTPIWQVIQNGTEAMVAGKGYIVRAPQDFDVEGASGAAAALYTANFIGKPNNGEVTIPVTGLATENKWNLIGNPYPSALDADLFLDLNADTNNILGGTLYFWTHNTGIGITENPTYSYASADYASWNGTGSAATSPGNNNAPSENIAAGQGFFVKGNASGDATFNNSMRIAGDNNQFFKSPTTVEKHRVWLNMKGTTKGFSQALVGYVTNATNGLDNRFDGETFGGNQVTFYSMLDTKALVIQGRALPFLDSDTVPLGYKSTITENISIGIDHFDGLFDNQNIYLEDTDLNIVHDLKDSDYTFAGVPGTFNSRFILRYQPEEVLANPTFEQELQSVIIRKNDAILRVNSPYETINTIWVYDLMGRLVFEQKNCNTHTFETNQITQTNQTLVVKVKLNNGGVVTEKILD